ncbi:MAG: MvdC/MvdD family ATP grasp protein [Acidobacteriota bacterium]|jgi:glutathione synthase/RimK-type ligase-like ATP-grasp enzyme
MTSDPYVLVLSTIADVATDEVIRRLAAHNTLHRRINTEDFPFSRTFAYRPKTKPEEYWMLTEHDPLPIPTAVWYRRVRSAPKPDGMDEGVYAFCLRENRAALLGSIMGLTARWMSHPAAVWQAEYKPFQLSLATKLGLAIPATVVTNDPLIIRKSFAEFERMVVKPTRSGHLTQSGQHFAIYTSQVLEQHLDELDSAKLCPAVYQALVPKRFDLRVTIVGHRVFAAAIDSQSDPMAMIDWRQTGNARLTHHPVTLPEAVTSKLLSMMESLHLAFGAIDMIEKPDGTYVFLEINPNGQWLWLDDMLAFGISDAIAAWLTKGAE